jgi:hypothetical protein
MAAGACKGVIKGGSVVLEEGATLAEGTEVLVTPLQADPGTPEASRSGPHVRPEDVDELERLIEEGQRPLSPIEPFRSQPTVIPRELP